MEESEGTMSDYLGNSESTSQQFKGIDSPSYQKFKHYFADFIHDNGIIDEADFNNIVLSIMVGLPWVKDHLVLYDRPKKKLQIYLAVSKFKLFFYKILKKKKLNQFLDALCEAFKAFDINLKLLPYCKDWDAELKLVKKEIEVKK